jgi:hypothetical protein
MLLKNNRIKRIFHFQVNIIVTMLKQECFLQCVNSSVFMAELKINK